MGKALIITEKPSVTRDIVEALGGFQEHDGGAFYESDDYICTYAVGHILELYAPEDIDPAFKRWRLADLPIIPEVFQVKPVAKQKDRVSVIKKLINRKDVDRVINACDAAREGELIFREIVNFLESKKPVQRLWLQSMTKKAIGNGFQVLEEGRKYEGLAAAAQCRAHADWLIGMNATRALTVRLKSRNQRGMSWSAGRVQTPTLSLLVDRELKILEHVPAPYWKVQGTFQAAGHDYKATWYDPNFKKPKSKTNADSEEHGDEKDDRIFTETAATRVVTETAGQSGEAAEVRRAQVTKAPFMFDLTTLQKAANSRFGWSAARTLRAAQRCYEAHKSLTYPRTSSRVLPSDYRPEVERILSLLGETEAYGLHAKYLLKNGMKNEEKVFDDAGVTDHFAIIPTGESRLLEGDDLKIYDLVARQFIAAFFPNAIYEVVERTTLIGGHHFRSRPPRVLQEAGWLAVFYEEKKGKAEPPFPPLRLGEARAEGVQVTPSAVTLERLETKPPARIGEAGLLSLMENAGRTVDDEELASALKKAEGLGTAATRADIIENLKRKEYVDQSLRPTVKGIRLIDVLHRINASRLTSAALTAELELHLNEVERGMRSSTEFMTEVASYTHDVVKAAREFDFDGIYPNVEPLGACPKCKREVFERAWFYGCTEATKAAGKKDCDFLIWKDYNGRYMDRQTVVLLLSTGKTGELEGFRSASGKLYRAVLELENGSITRHQIEGTATDLDGNPEVELNSEPLGTCPAHGADCQVVETPSDFICLTKRQGRENGDRSAAGFSLPRNLCKREMKRSEVLHMMAAGETEFLTGFISKRGRKFSAKLKLENQASSFTFVFPERGARKAKDDLPTVEPATTDIAVPVT